MKIFSTGRELEAALATATGTRGFVPTMGALHEGHLSLVTRSRQECETTVVSIFVNPTQFNDPSDLKSYPRNIEADLALLEKAGADLVYVPAVEDVYPEPDRRTFDFGGLDRVMEGTHRPGHFNGVAQVVTRLFDRVACDRAYFGEKDFQQVAIVRHLVRQGGYRTQIVACPIIREADGLALSSRNQLLTPEHRQAAPLIYRTLCDVARWVGTVGIDELRSRVKERIDADPLLKTEYFNIVNSETLQDVGTWDEAAALRGCIAVRAGNVRLIDNIAMTAD